MLQLEDILKLKGSEAVNLTDPKLKFSNVSIDSRNIKSSELFFAVKGEKYDAHNFLYDLKDKINAAVVNKEWYDSLNKNETKGFKKLCLIKVNDTTASLGELAKEYRKKFTIPVIAISGSNGKTTTRDLVSEVLAQKYNVHRTKGNLNNQFGVPLTIFGLKKEHDLCLLELGTNHFGEIKYLCDVSSPQFGLITNIAKEHLEFLKDIKGVLNAEGELIDHLKNNYGTFFWNYDDKYLYSKAKIADKKIKYGSSDNADVKAELIKFDNFYPVVNIKYNNIDFNVRSSLIGYTGYYTTICAATIGLYFKINPEKIKKAISEFSIVTHSRNELKRCGEYWVIDDTYNSNPDSVIAAFNNIKGFGMEKKAHIVLSDMLELGKRSKKEHALIGKLAGEYGFENIYTFGGHSYETYKNAKGIKNNLYFKDKQTLTNVLKKMIKKDDIVLIKGSRGMKMDEISELLINCN